MAIANARMPLSGMMCAMRSFRVQLTVQRGF